MTKKNEKVDIKISTIEVKKDLTQKYTAKALGILVKINQLPDKEAEKYRKVIIKELILNKKENLRNKRYLKKAENLIEKLTKLPSKQADKYRKIIIETILLTGNKRKSEKEIDKWEKDVEQERQKYIAIKIVNPPFWIKLKKKENILSIYEKLSSTQNISYENISKLSKYAEVSSNILFKILENQAYFTNKTDLEGQLYRNSILKKYINPQIIRKILLGKTNPSKLIEELKKISKETGDKKKNCEKLTEIFGNFYASKFLGQLAQSKPHIIDINNVIEKKNIKTTTVEKILKKIIYSQEYKNIAANGWENLDSYSTFIAGIILTSNLNNKINHLEINRNRAKLHAKKLYLKNKNRLIKLLKKTEQETLNIKLDLESAERNTSMFESKDKRFYMVDPETGKATKHFKKLIELEQKYLHGKEKKTLYRLRLAQNKARYTTVLRNIKDIWDAENSEKHFQDFNITPINRDFNTNIGFGKGSFEDQERLFNEFKDRENIYKEGNREIPISLSDKDLQFYPDQKEEPELITAFTANFSEVACIKSEYLTTWRQRMEKENILNNPELLYAELLYRKSIRTGKKMENQNLQTIVLERKNNEGKRYEKELEKLQKIIDDKEGPYVKGYISEYKTLKKVPETEEELAFDRTTVLIKTLNNAAKLINRIHTIDVEMKLIGGKGLNQGLIQKYKNQYATNKNLFSQSNKFIGKKQNLSEININNPEIQGLILGHLNKITDPYIVDPSKKVMEEGKKVTNIFKYLNKLGEQGKKPSFDQLDEAIKQVKNLEEAMSNAQNNILKKAIPALKAEANNKTGIYADYPELFKAKKLLIKKIIANLGKELDTTLSSTQTAEIGKARMSLEKLKDEMIYSTFVNIGIFIVTVASAVLSGGIASFATRKLLGVTAKATVKQSIVMFTTTNIAVAGGVTVGSRLAKEGSNAMGASNFDVDWSGYSVASDFTRNLVLSAGASGAGMVLGKVLNKIKIGNSGFTYGELTALGLTRMSTVNKILNPFGANSGTRIGPTTGTTKTANLLTSMKRAGKGFIGDTGKEIVDESYQNVLSKLHPALEFASGASGASKTDINIDTKSNSIKKLKNIGIRFNKNYKRYEFDQKTTEELVTDLRQNLGTNINKVEIKTNKDGSITLKVNETKKTVTIHPKAESEVITETSDIDININKIPNPLIQSKIKRAWEIIYKSPTTLSKTSWKITVNSYLALRGSLDTMGKYWKNFRIALDKKMFNRVTLGMGLGALQNFYEAGYEAYKMTKTETEFTINPNEETTLLIFNKNSNKILEELKEEFSNPTGLKQQDLIYESEKALDELIEEGISPVFSFRREFIETILENKGLVAHPSAYIKDFKITAGTMGRKPYAEDGETAPRYYAVLKNPKDLKKYGIKPRFTGKKPPIFRGVIATEQTIPLSEIIIIDPKNNSVVYPKKQEPEGVSSPAVSSSAVTFEIGSFVNVYSNTRQKLESGWKLVGKNLDENYIVYNLDYNTVKAITAEQLIEWNSKRKKSKNKNRLVNKIKNLFISNPKKAIQELKNINPEQKKLLIDLFPKGIEISHFKQGNTGDCYLLAVLHVIKRHPVAPYIFSKMIKQKSKDSWEITFPGETEPIIVNESDLKGQLILDREKGEYKFKHTVTGQKGDKMLEVAFARLRKRKLSSQQQNKPAQTMAIVESGWMKEALNAFLKDIKQGKVLEIGDRFHRLNNKKEYQEKIEAKLKKFSQNPHTFLLTVATPSNIPTPYMRKTGSDSEGRIRYYMDPAKKFVQNHAYSITAVDTNKRLITISNPHDTKIKEYTISYEQFFDYFSVLQGVKLDTLKIEGAKFLNIPVIKGELDVKLTNSIKNEYEIDNQALIIHLGESDRIPVFITDNGDLFLDTSQTGTKVDGFRLKPGQEEIIGRNTLPGLDSKTSGSHIKIQYTKNGKIIITDLNSTNGTVVQKTPLSENEIRLKNKIEKEDVIAKQPKVQEEIYINRQLESNIENIFNLKNDEIDFLVGEKSLLKTSINEKNELVIEIGDIKFKLKSGESKKIGRNTIPELDPSISRDHLKITYHGGGNISITDLATKNGTYIKKIRKVKKIEQATKRKDLTLEKHKKYQLELTNITGLNLAGHPITINKGSNNIINFSRITKEGMLMHFLRLKPGEEKIIGRNEYDFLPQRTSRKHVEIRNNNGTLEITDIGSSFGTTITII